MTTVIKHLYKICSIAHLGNRKKCAQKQHVKDKLANQKKLDILLDKNSFSHPYLETGRRYLNDIIKRYNTFYCLINGFEMLALKVDSNPKMKYVNIPS